MPPWVEREVVASYLLDVAGAWRWMAGTATALDAMPLDLPPLVRDHSRPLVWVRSDRELHEAVTALMAEDAIGLDVETTIGSRTLCLIQIAGRSATYMIDALEVADLGPLAALLASRATTKIIQNASFGREVLGRQGLTIDPVVDTRDLSRQRHGDRADGGHGLRAICARELKLALDKTEQSGDWTRRPLTDAQIAYAALDAEVLLRLRERLGD
jgi:ATP-dependent Lhr-like helicase